MAVIRDVMPMFELLQPTSVADALALLDRHGGRRLGPGRRARHVRLVQGSHQAAAVRRRSERRGRAQRHPHQRRRPRDRRDDDADRGGAASGGARALRHSARRRGVRRVAADPQSGHDRRQRDAGRALLVLPRRLALLPRRRQHLLRRYAAVAQPRARHLRRRSLRGGQSLGHGARADRARRADGDEERRRASASSRPRTISSGQPTTSRA